MHAELSIAEFPRDVLEADEVTPDEEAGLVQASREGDRSAFAILYERHRPGIYRLCKKRLRSAAVAEDATQETFVKAFAALSTFEAGRPIWPWLATIADNHCIDILRRSGRSTPTEGVGEEQAAGAHEEQEAVHDPTGYAVVEAERWREITDTLATLPARQRRVLLLYALDGWNYADIATAEQVSVSSVKSLIFRARRYMRRAYELGPLGLFVLPLQGLKRKAEDVAVRARQVGGSPLEGVFLGAGHTIMQTAVALSVLLSAGTATSAQAAEPLGSIILQEDAAAVEARAGSAPETLRPQGARSQAPSERPVHESAAAFAQKHLLEPGDGASPEDTRFTSVVASPSFERDGTLFAAGEVGCLRPPCRVLFISHDRGASWDQLQAANLSGRWLLLPPSYPEDPRIFAMGPAGLQQSTDGGASFETLAPLSGRAAIAPTFNAGDPRILIGGASVTEYLADRRIIRPAAMLAQSNLTSDIAFSPSYSADDPVIVIGAEKLGPAEPFYRSTVYRCEGTICSEAVLPGSSGMPIVRLSPDFANDGVAYAFTGFGIFRSTDGARTFTEIDLPSSLKGGLMDVEFLSTRGGTWDGTLFIGGLNSSGDGLYVSRDHGATWDRVAFGMSRFAGGVTHLSATPTGIIFAASADTGIACSTDGGRSWAERCNPR